MSPVAIFIKSLRHTRKLSQKDALALLGVEQSYLSAIETGRMDFPRYDFRERLIEKYRLTDLEIEQLDRALKISNRHFFLPRNASEQAFEISNELFSQIDKLSTAQVNFIKLTLNMSQ